MFVTVRYSVAAFLTLNLASLSGCGAGPKPVPAMAASATVKAPNPEFSVNTPLDIIAANPNGKAVLLHDLPGLMASRSYILFDDMSLSQIAPLSGGHLTTAKLDVVQADLSQLSHPPPYRP